MRNERSSQRTEERAKLNWICSLSSAVETNEIEKAKKEMKTGKVAVALTESIQSSLLTVATERYIG